MKNIQVRNVPERVHKVLRRRAADAGQSLQEYLLQLLEESAARPTMKDFLESVAGRDGARKSKPFDSAKLIREIRDERDDELWERVRRDRR